MRRASSVRMRAHRVLWVSASRGESMRTFCAERGHLVHHTIADVCHPRSRPPPLLAEAQLLLVPRQNVAAQITHAIRAQGESTQLSRLDLLRDHRIGHLANDAKLSARSFVGRQDVPHRRPPRVVLDVEGQPVGVRDGQLARAEVGRVVAGRLGGRVGDTCRPRREGWGWSGCFEWCVVETADIPRNVSGVVIFSCL